MFLQYFHNSCKDFISEDLPSVHIDRPGRRTVNPAELIEQGQGRKKNLLTYNDARRQLLLEHYASLDDLDDLADNEDLELQRSVYTGFHG